MFAGPRTGGPCRPSRLRPLHAAGCRRLQPGRATPDPSTRPRPTIGLPLSSMRWQPGAREMLLHDPIDLDRPILPAPRAEEMGPGDAVVDEHAAPTGVLVTTLQTLFTVLDSYPVLAEDHGPSEDHCPPHPDRLGWRRGRPRYGRVLLGRHDGVLGRLLRRGPEVAS